MEILELSGYTEEQKLHIARNYLLPKQLEANGLKKDELTLDDAALFAHGAYVRGWIACSACQNLHLKLNTLIRVARSTAANRP